MRWRSLLAPVVACMVVAACGRPPEPAPVREDEPPITYSNQAAIDADELKQLMQRCDVGRLMVVLQEVLGSPASADQLIFLSNAWDDGGGDPGVKACMQKDAIRVSAANALAQAQANRMLEVPQLASVLDTLRSSLKSPSSEVAQIAMMGLGDFLTETDIAQLGQIALADNCGNANSAYATLALSCEPKAREELDRLAKIDQVRADKVREFRERMQEARKLNCDSELE